MATNTDVSYSEWSSRRLAGMLRALGKGTYMLKWRRIVQAALLTGELEYSIVLSVELPKLQVAAEEVVEIKPKLLQEEVKNQVVKIKSLINKPGAKATAQMSNTKVSNKMNTAKDDVQITGVKSSPGSIMKKGPFNFK